MTPIYTEKPKTITEGKIFYSVDNFNDYFKNNIHFKLISTSIVNSQYGFKSLYVFYTYEI